MGNLLVGNGILVGIELVLGNGLLVGIGLVGILDWWRMDWCRGMIGVGAGEWIGGNG